MKFLWSILKRKNKKKSVLKQDYLKSKYARNHKSFFKYMYRYDSSPIVTTNTIFDLFCLPLKIDKVAADNTTKLTKSPNVVVDKDTYSLTSDDMENDSDVKDLSRWTTVVNEQIDTYVQDQILNKVKGRLPNLELVKSCHYFLVKNKFIPHGLFYLQTNKIGVAYSRQSVSNEIVIRKEMFYSFLMDSHNTVTLKIDRTPPPSVEMPRDKDLYAVIESDVKGGDEYQEFG